MFYKTIIQGRFDFGTLKSYEKVYKMFQYRIDTYYRTDIIFKLEDIFKPESLSMELERFVGTVTEKSYKNTADLLTYCAQFAINGTVRAWLLDNGEILQYHFIEPESDKAAVQSFIKGRSLIRVEGMQNEAIAELSKAIEKYDRHAQAYERRAKISFLLKNFHDAMRDYNKSLNIDPTIPTAYYGRARIHMLNENWQDAVNDFNLAIKRSVALEPVHWKSRRLKGECHLYLNQYPEAEFELKLFTQRNFKVDDPINGWKRRGYYHYGLVLMELKKYLEAMVAFDTAYGRPDLNDGVEISELLKLRGLAKKRAGKTGFLIDIKEAIRMGNASASKLLKELA